MISVVRFIGRRIFARSIVQSRWMRRTLVVVAIFRWFRRRSESPYDVRLQRGEVVDVIITKERNGK
jgi:hypothetical protein